MAAEESLREGLSHNYEEARALLGRLEYQRGNVEAALRVFDGIDLGAVIQRLQPSLSEKPLSKRSNKLRSASSYSGPQHTASLVLEAIYLKSMSLQKLGKPMEAAKECKSVLDAVESVFQCCIPGAMVEQKLQETVSKSVELLPELWKQAEAYQEAFTSYRRALLIQWNLDDECHTRIQKRFAVFLLFCGVEVAPPSLASQTEGSFVPGNNLEEAILLLMILMRKWFLGKTHWDPSVMEHLTFALSLCGQTSILAKHLEEVLPAIYPRIALCYFAASQNKAALNLLRKSLNKAESPNDVMVLLLAAKICSSSYLLSFEGVEYAIRAVKDAESSNGHLKSVALHFLGSCLAKKSMLASSDHQRSLLQTEALKSLNEAISLDRRNPELIFDTGIKYAEHRNNHAAMKLAKEYIDATGGSVSTGNNFVYGNKMDLPENKLTEFMDNDEKPKWRTVNNHNICEFTEDDIKRITQNYTRPIGEGAFGQVYKGVFYDGSLVAVKKYINQNFKQGFAKEVTVHCQINHKNVVRLLGYCADENSLTLVTEFMYNGNLSNLLHGCDDQIDLEERLCIAVDCAEALTYMHCSMYQAIIHGDIKPANILLDDNLRAKLSDFGISRLLTMDRTQYTMNVIGSRGYVDPEFILKGRIDPKNDVYSFGVVLLELITRRKACENGITTDLTESFVNAVKQGKMPRSMFDAEIASVSNMKIMHKVGELAAACLSSDMKKRPQMKHVSEFLYKLRQKYQRQGQEKIGKWPLWGTEKINQDSAITSSSNSTFVYKAVSFDIFKRNARDNFNRNAGPILESISGLRILTREELRPILRPSNIIGRGRFGPVYRGLLGGQHVVAKQSISFDQKEHFANELIAQSKITHKNIVKLIGCCLEVDVPIMVYEFVSKGSLSEILHGRRKKPIDFDVRLKIAAGSAEGLTYILGTSTLRHLIFKPANVLLDDNFEPKISDFGFSLTDYGISDMDYMDQGYLQTGTLTDKTATYSFGVFLLELICRKKVKHSDNDSLVKNFFDPYKNGDRAGSLFFDMEIALPRNIELLEELATIAWTCLNADEEKRGEMADVASCLQTLKRSHVYRMHDYSMPSFNEDSQ